jgi:hypothetical protein
MKRKQEQADQTPELLRDLLIVELANAGVQQLDIRKIVGCDIHRVSKIAKVLKKAKKQVEKQTD